MLPARRSPGWFCWAWRYRSAFSRCSPWSAGSAAPRARRLRVLLLLGATTRAATPSYGWAFGAVLFGGAYQIVTEIKRGDADRGAMKAYHRAVRDTLFDACWV